MITNVHKQTPSSNLTSSVDFTDLRSVTSMEDLGFSMPLRGSENPSISYYTNIILYKGKFYTEKEKLQVVNLNNRIDIPYVPSDISLLGKLEDIDEYDKGILLSDTFHYNMGHLLWDFMYPSYYGLLFHKEEDSNNDFQWMTLENINKDHHIDIIEKFSGNKVTTPILLSNKYEKPLKIPYLIVGIQNIGIGCVKKDFNVSWSERSLVAWAESLIKLSLSME